MWCHGEYELAIEAFEDMLLKDVIFVSVGKMLDIILLIYRQACGRIGKWIEFSCCEHHQNLNVCVRLINIVSVHQQGIFH